MENDLCKLCGKGTQVDSHIIPKFIFRWLKKSGTGRLRNIEDINTPKQDGRVVKFLCSNCEGLFNTAETYFSNEIFHPVIQNCVVEFQYDHRLRYFLISLFWRVLKDSLYIDVENTVWYHFLLSAEKEWSDYLLNGKPLQNFNEIHMIVGVDVIKGNDDFRMFMARAVDAGIPNNDDTCLFYIKLPRFIILMPISGFDLKLFKNSRIGENGLYNLNSASIKDPTIGQHFIERSQMFDRTTSRMSGSQKKSTQNFTKNKESDLLKNDLGRITRFRNP